MDTTRIWRGWLCALLFTASGLAAGQAAEEPGLALEGVLTVLRGDPNPGIGGRSKTLYLLNADDGRRFELDLSAAALPPGGLRPVLNKRVRVIVSPAAAQPFGVPPRLEVRELQALEAAEPKITGNQAFISILCKFPGAATPEPRPPQFFIDQLGTTAPGFNHYFREASYNTLTLDGSAVTTVWVNMPQPRTFYIDGVKLSSTYLTELFKDCTNAADASVNFAQFYGVNLMFNDQLDDAAWGGGSLHTLDGITKGWPATWMPYWGEMNSFGWRNHSILAHEMSHAFGAPHSESPDANEYGSSWDVVSSPGATADGEACRNVDATYGCLGQSMNAYAKVTIEILPANRQATHSAGTQSYTIERLTQPPTGTSVVYVKVPIAGTTTRFYTVEARHRTGYDAQLPGDGVIIHEVDTSRDRQARLRAPGGTGAGLGGLMAVWPVGSTYVSGADNVSIRVDSFSVNGTAVVTVGPAPAGALTASPTSLDFAGQSMNTTSPAMSTTITNPTAAPIAVTGVAASAGFAVTHNCVTIAAGASCTANATFTPPIAATGGTVSGTLTIQTASGSTIVTLTGMSEKSLVTHYYRSILRRAPDAGGKTFWEGEATRVSGLGASVNETWFAMAQAFYFSAEYAAFNRNNTAFATDLYTTFFNRAPDGGGLAFWLGQLDTGMPREVALASFMFSAEFVNFTTAIFGNVSARAEVNAIVDFYRGLLARTPDTGGFNFWVGRFRTAQCQGPAAITAEVEAISSAFALSAEYAARSRSSAQYVGDLYNAFLRRGGDLGGVQFWIGQVDTNAQTREQVRVQFRNSSEFQGRVQAIIQQGCLP